VDARPILARLARGLNENGLEAIRNPRGSGHHDGFEGVRKRASRVVFDGHTLLVADLSDIIKSKRKADRPQDRAVLDVLEETLHEKKKIQEGDS